MTHWGQPPGLTCYAAAMPPPKPDESPTPSSALQGFQRKHLRKLAHSLKPVVHVGAAGISPSLLDALTAALADHELVKVRLHEPDDKKGLSRSLAERSGGRARLNMTERQHHQSLFCR